MSSRKSHRRRRGGFTLIELLLVLVILVILGSFAVGMFSNTQRKALVRQAEGQIGLFKTPIDTYHLDMNHYPPDLESLSAPSGNMETSNRWDGPYIETIPMDPWGRPYQYSAPGRNRPDTYDLWSLGPDGQDGTDDDVGNWMVQ